MKRCMVTALLVLGLLLPSVGIQAQRQSDSGILAGANLNLPFVRRSRVLGGFHNGTDYRANNFTSVVAARERSLDKPRSPVYPENVHSTFRAGCGSAEPIPDRR